MAGRSLLSRVFSTPAAVFCSSGIGSAAQLSFPSFSSERENANNFPARPSRLSRSGSIPYQRAGREPVSVCRVLDVGLDVEVEGAKSASLETRRAALQGSFETQAAVGRVECNSRGCRPIFDHQTVELDTVSKTHHLPKEFTEFLNDVWMENGAAQNYFEVAVEANPLDSKLLCEYASFSWKLQHDADKAEDLYKQALEVAPNDADIIASYALFLWQSDL
ncbi:hypothetical protein M758_2G202800 [Ceratodon purpureus]|nr:hypothetical protein M758_2G202800 [Ceratodon purpureus]